MGGVKEHNFFISNPNCNSDQYHAMKKYLGHVERQGTRKYLLRQEKMTLFFQWEAKTSPPFPHVER